jgi:hypothetical protein
VALSAPHPRTWVDGHHGAAVVASHYFRVDNRLDERTSRALAAHVDGFVAHDPNEFPEPDPGPGTADPARIVERLDAQIADFRANGHDVIYAALALRALRDLPAFATPRVVDGMVRLLDQVKADRRPVAPMPWQRDHPLELRGPPDLAAATLRETLRPWDHVRRAGASGVIHWITHAEALVTLDELGHGDVACRGFDALFTHVRHEPQEGGAAPDRARLDWLSPDYWEGDEPRRLFGGSWLGGHAFKLPHSLFRLLRRVDDSALREAALVRAAQLQAPFL